jgi:SAM-dependent methyltransferase
VKARLKGRLGPLWAAGSELYWWARARRHRWSPVRWIDNGYAWAFDRRYGVDTRTIVPAVALLPESEALVASGYQGSSLRLVKRLLRCASASPSEFQFIDIGSGMGRVLVVAADLGFREVIGVEISKPLADSAATLLKRYTEISGRSVPYRIVNTDVAQFEFPAADTVIFMYNPFTVPVMQMLIDALAASLRQHERRLVIVYANAVYHQLFDALPFLRLLHQGRYNGDPWRIYGNRLVSAPT